MGCGGSNAAGGGSNKQGLGGAKKRLLEEYTVGETLGEGAFGVVYACTKRDTGAQLAVKMVDKVETPVAAIQQEAEMLEKMDHPNIVKFHQVIYERCFVCIVVDLYKGGDLVEGMQHHWKTKGKIPCQNSVHVCKQMAESIAYLHERMVVHRDVKGDNFLMNIKDIADTKCHIALSDFGTAYKMADGQRLRDGVGTKIFWSPEFFDREYSFKVDVWAMGVIMYGLLDGRFPFRDENDVKSKQLRFPKGTAPACEDYTRKMLEKRESDRISAADLLKHEWLTGQAPAAGAPGAPGAAHDPNDKEWTAGALREGGANHGMAERRRELVERMENENENTKKKASGGKTEQKVEHYWAEWFTIVDKHATNSTLKFEWWKQQKISDSGILNYDGTVITDATGGTGTEKSSIEVIRNMLQEHNIDANKFGVGEAKSLVQMTDEIQSGAARLMLDARAHKRLVRVVDVVVLRLTPANAKGGKYLIEMGEQFPDGRKRSDLYRLPGTKKEPHENTKKVAERILKDMLNMSDCKVVFDPKSKEVFEEEFESPSFPGLWTVYRKELVEGTVTTADPVVLKRIGNCNDSFQFEDSKRNIKFLSWLPTKVCQQKKVILKAPENSEDASGLVQAPIGLSEDDLTKYLTNCGVDISKFGEGHTKTVKDISIELTKGEASLMQDNQGKVLRVVDLVVVKIINSVTGNILVQTEQLHADGTKVTLNRLPGTKRRPDENQFLTARRVLRKQLKMDENQVNLNASDVQIIEESKESASYPGLQTVYRKRIITAELMRGEAPAAANREPP